MVYSIYDGNINAYNFTILKYCMLSFYVRSESIYRQNTLKEKESKTRIFKLHNYWWNEYLKYQNNFFESDPVRSTK